jgi:tRNA dimethylallyltransferase
VGYRELLEVEENAIDLQTAIERIKQNTRHFAKRQLTWLRHQVAGTPVDMAAENAQVDAARCVSAFLRRR